MSFFGFDPSAQPGSRPQQQRQGGGGGGGAPGRGMFDQHDPFAELGQGVDPDDEALNFDDTYDGLGKSLDESGDTFNDDTFGDEQPVTRQSVGRDFDFAGNTAKARGVLLEEQTLHHARQPMQQFAAPSRPAKTGYESYKQPDYIPKLEADASIWGSKIAKKPEQAPKQEAAPAGRKMMSLDEVEAAMRAQTKPPAPPMPQDTEQQSAGLRAMLGVGGPAPQQPPPQQMQQKAPQILQRSQQQQQAMPNIPPSSTPDYNLRAPQILQREQSPQLPQQPRDFQGPPQQQMQFQQPPQGPAQQVRGPPVQPPQGPMHPMAHQRGPSYGGPPITQAQQMMQMSPEEREQYLEEEAKRAKRNHKIFMLSKNNGVMTPQDKNFITRIQLQQLLTATGGIDNAPGSDQQLAEDFYYQVYSQIRGPPRTEPGQPLNQFAQTYLFQTGSRYGYGRNRNHPRGGDNHVQRMEQQVARAVEAAKARPKNKHLVVEGSLGKIAFSNSKTPRPLLNLKRNDSQAKMAAKPMSVADRKTALRDIENVYSTLMRMEDHERHLPPPPNEESPPDVIEGHMHWRSEMQALNQQIWAELKVMEPIGHNPTAPHPFIALLSHGKGKKVFPRVFRHLDDQQRLTVLTLLAIHLDSLDVIRLAHPSPENTPLPPRIKEEVDLFSAAVIPQLFTYVNEAPLNIVIGLLGLVLDRSQSLPTIARTKVGSKFLMMLISRAELAKNAAPPNSPDVTEWNSLYTRLFDALEPVLPWLFNANIPVAMTAVGEDTHVWQFLAAMGVGTGGDSGLQTRLVMGVKERVMETVGVSKTLPQEMAERRLAEVNLFMRAIGLDVELLG
ncbi:hypothetical protein MBLNU230_g2974t1 [Neophaeotheca triangularis]